MIWSRKFVNLVQYGVFGSNLTYEPIKLTLNRSITIGLGRDMKKIWWLDIGWIKFYAQLKDLSNEFSLWIKYMIWLFMYLKFSHPHFYRTQKG
jgi:hypothetical protein